MRRLTIALFTLCLALIFQAVPNVFSAEPPVQEPVLVFARMFATDPINIEITEARLRRTLGMLEDLRKQFPGANVKVTIYVNGAVAEMLDRRNAQSGVKDLLLEASRKGVIEIGYDALSEPRSSDLALVNATEVNGPRESYLARTAVAGHVLSDGRDPSSGKILNQADGGLKRMQQVFGPAASIWGAQVFSIDPATGSMPDWGSDSEMVRQIQLLNTKATLTGILEDVPHMDFVYDDWIPVFAKNLSASMDASPDVYWQENRLRISERSDKESKVPSALAGTAEIKEYLEKLNRSKIRLVMIDIGSDRPYLTSEYQKYTIYPPSKYAAAHPDSPKLPAGALAKDAEISAGIRKEQDALSYVLGSFFSSNPDSRMVVSGDLLGMTPPAYGYRVPMPALRQSLAEVRTAWGEQARVPRYVKVGDRYLSLAQTTQVLAEALVERRRTGKLPESVEVLNVYGPIDLSQTSGAAKTEVSADDVAIAAIYLLPGFYPKTWTPLPTNSVPTQVKVGKVTVNGGQYLRLMIDALLADNLDARLTVQPTSMVWGPEALGFKTRPDEEMGTIWTIKPAPLELSKISAKAQ